MAATPLDSPLTSMGVSRVVVVPSPRLPLELLPQHFTPPVNSSAHVCKVSALIFVATSSSGGGGGLGGGGLAGSGGGLGGSGGGLGGGGGEGGGLGCCGLGGGGGGVAMDATPLDSPLTAMGVRRIVSVPSPS
jgi:hypothetical protein